MKRQMIFLLKKTLPLKLRLVLRSILFFIIGLIQFCLRLYKGSLIDPISGKTYLIYLKKKKDFINYSNFTNSRQRFVFLFLMKSGFIKDSEIVLLHIAPEIALYRRFKKQFKNYMPADKKAYGYDYSKDTVDLDLTNMNCISSESIDVFVCNHVLEHIPNDKAAMEEVFRVLKAKGNAIITVPIDDSLHETYEDSSIVKPADRKKHFGQWDHIRLYAKDIVFRFREIGFEATLINSNEFLKKEEEEMYKIHNEYLLLLRKSLYKQNY